MLHRVRWAIPAVMVVVLACAAGVGLLVRALQPFPGVAGAGVIGAEVTGAGPVGAGPVGDSAPPDTREPGPTVVVLVEDVGVHPDADRARRVLQRYFDAINSGDYKLWRSTVTPQQARDTGEGAWRGQYRSTLDGSIVLHRLEPRAGGGLVALLSFTSLQNPADAPPELPVRCLRWRVSYPMIGEGAELWLGPSSPIANLVTPC